MKNNIESLKAKFVEFQTDQKILSDYALKIANMRSKFEMEKYLFGAVCNNTLTEAESLLDEFNLFLTEYKAKQKARNHE